MSFKLILFVFALLTVFHESTCQYYGGYPTAYGNNYYGGLGGYGGYGYGGYPSGGYYGDYGYGYPAYSGYVGKRSSRVDSKGDMK